MLCQICKKNPATVHLTEISHFPVQDPADGAASASGDGAPKPEQQPEQQSEQQAVFEERHICDSCAHRAKIPFSAVAPTKGLAVWAMLKESARRARAEKNIACPECGMTLADFKSTGRLGCPNDYLVFREQIQPLLLRIHNAVSHVGRLPGQDPEERARQRQLSNLREQLERAIREEEYENAARLRDEIQGLETAHGDS